MQDWVLVDNLTVELLRAHPVWEYVNQEESVPDTAVRPVNELPVDDLGNRLVGAQITLNNGSVRWATLGNISLAAPRATQHFLCVSIEGSGTWFHLARYFDVDFEHRGPAALAQFLGFPVSDVFPMRYDISALVLGGSSVAKGEIQEEPQERLSLDQIIELALDD